MHGEDGKRRQEITGGHEEATDQTTRILFLGGRERKTEVRSRGTAQNSLEGATGAFLAGFGFFGAGGHTRRGLRTCSSDLGVTQSSSSVLVTSGRRPSAGLSRIGVVLMGGTRGNSPITTTSAPMGTEDEDVAETARETDG
ncbi:unnamed protein product [Musa acuminata subsp. burmannicoides]